MEPDLELDAVRKSALDGILMPRAEAMLLLAEASEPEGIATLSTILETDPDVYTRAAAALALGRVRGGNPEDHLLRLLHRVGATAQKQIFLSLARVGMPRALFAAGAATEYSNEQVAAAARFAATVIAHRYNIPGHDWLSAESGHRMELAEKNSRNARLGRVAPNEEPALVNAFASSPFGLQYSRSRSLTLECGGKSQVLALAAETPHLASLFERKSVAGAVLTKNIESEQYSISHVVLTSPDGSGGVRIVAPRTSGVGGLVGSGRMEGERGHFELHSIPSPGAVAIAIEGTLENSEMKLTRVQSGRERMGVRVPATG